MAVVQKEVGAVLLRSDRKTLDRLQNFTAGNRELETARCTLVGFHFSGENEARLLARLADSLEQLLGNVFLEQHALAHASSIAQLHEVQLALRSLVVNPTLKSDRLADVVSKPLDRGDGAHEIDKCAEDRRSGKS